MRNSILMRMMGIGAIAAALSLGASASEVKLGTVDMQKAIQNVEAGKKAKSTLEKEITSKKKEIDTEQAAVEKMFNEFKKQSLVMNEEARAKKEGEIRERGAKLQEAKYKAQQDLQRREQELTEPIVTKIRALITEVAKQKGYQMVLEKNENTVLYSQEKDDLTSEIITAFNKQNKG